MINDEKHMLAADIINPKLSASIPASSYNVCYGSFSTFKTMDNLAT